jgi:hypothetical protein
MREMMHLPETKKNQARCIGSLTHKDIPETVPMHPEDMKAHLAWITAKRFSELLKETPAEKTIY